MYHVSLDLSPDEVRETKRLALNRSLTVKALVTGLVRKELSKAAQKPEHPAK